MRKNRIQSISIKLLFLSVFAAMTLGLTACGDPQLKVNYSVDGVKVEEMPSRGLYEIVSIRCSNKKANATFDCDSWSLKTEPLTKNTTVDLDFTYTDSPITVNGRGYEDLQAAFNAAGTQKSEIHITRDITGSGITPLGSDITLVMNGFFIEGSGTTTIENCGTLNIVGNGTIANSEGSGENCKCLVNYGTLSASNITFTNHTDCYMIWNSNNGQSQMTLNNCEISRTGSDVIALINSGNLSLNGCNISGGGDLTHPALLQNDAAATLEVAGSTITNTGSGYSLYRESGSVIVSDDSNCPNSYGVE